MKDMKDIDLFLDSNDKENYMKCISLRKHMVLFMGTHITIFIDYRWKCPHNSDIP